jgi:hypothetical protein
MMAVYPCHKIIVDKFVAQGVVLGIGPFLDGGNMARLGIQRRRSHRKIRSFLKG